MSTIDPTLARKQRKSRRPGPVRIGVLLGVLLVGGFAVGYGWGGFSLTETAEAPWVLTLVSAIGGIWISALGMVGWGGVILKRADVGIGYGLAALLLGGGVGLLAAVAQKGSSPLGLAIGCALLGLSLLTLLLGLVAALSRARQTARDERTIGTGTLTTATVSDKGYEAFNQSSRILTAVTFTFVDLRGVRRWVQKPMLLEQRAPVFEGQETRLWYDASDPGDEKGIVVELAREGRMRR